MKEVVLALLCCFLLATTASWAAAQLDYDGGLIAEAQQGAGEIDYDDLNALFRVRPRQVRAAATTPSESGSGDGELTPDPPCGKL